MSNDLKLALINGWRVVPPTDVKYEYIPTGLVFGDKVEVVCYRNGQRFDTMFINKNRLK